MMEMSEKNENNMAFSQKRQLAFNDDNNDTFVIPLNLSLTMIPSSAARNIASQQSHAPRLCSLNGGTDTRNVTQTTTRSDDNSKDSGGSGGTRRVSTRGIINRNNLNSKSDQGARNGQQPQHKQKHSSFLSGVHLNDDNRRMDAENNKRNGSSSPTPLPSARHVKTDHDNVRYDDRSSVSPPASSSSINSSFNAASRCCSLTKKKWRSDDGCSGGGPVLNTQKLDSFLDFYEGKNGLEPLETNQVHGVSGSNFNVSSLLPLSRLITDEDDDAAAAAPSQSNAQKSRQKTTQILEKDLRNSPISSPFSSLDLSWLPAETTLSQDDIQDKDLSNNNNKYNGKYILNSQSTKQPLSSIKEEAEKDAVKTCVGRKNASKSRCSYRHCYHDDKIDKTGAAIDTTTQVKADNKKKGKRNNSRIDHVDITEEDNTGNFVTEDFATKKTSGERKKDKNNKKEERKKLFSAAPEVSKTGKLLSEMVSSVVRLVSTSTEGPPHTTSVTGASLPRKSRIPVPLPKTKRNTDHREDKIRPSCTTSLDKISNDTSNFHAGRAKQVRVDRGIPVEKGEENRKTSSNSNNSTVMASKRTSFPKRPSTAPALSTARPLLKPTSNSSSSKSSSTNRNTHVNNKVKVSQRLQIGQGDEVTECLNLIDGLSEHTTWAMNKILEFPLCDQDAMKRIRKLQETPSIGDFFGVPYVKREIFAHLLFSGSRPE